MAEIELNEFSVKDNKVSLGGLNMGVQQVGGGITQETDPTVPDWAKQPEKPKYDYSEIENTPDLTELNNKVDEASHTAFVADQNATTAREDVATLNQELNDKVDYDTLSQAVTSLRTESKNYTDLMCNGANKAVSFDNYSRMIEVLNNKQYTGYSVGQNIYIRTINVPDLWVYGTMSVNKPYTYTSDSDFINELNEKTIVQVGHFMLAMLETQKVDLTDYAKTEYVDNNKMPIPTNLTKDNEYVVTYNPAKKVSSVNTLVKASASGTEAPYPLSFVKVNEYGQFTTADPTGDYHCTNKKYVDDKIGDIETALDELHNYAQSLTSGGESE